VASRRAARIVSIVTSILEGEGTRREEEGEGDKELTGGTELTALLPPETTGVVLTVVSTTGGRDFADFLVDILAADILKSVRAKVDMFLSYDSYPLFLVGRWGIPVNFFVGLRCVRSRCSLPQ
jgi:hypothetical protein